MGCGRSTLGSDSPKKKNKKKEAEDSSDYDDDSSGGGCDVVVSGSRGSKHLAPFISGGPILAQAKVSDSQLDFFRMLDEKIENGPDYESEDEEYSRRRRLEEYARQWDHMTRSRPPSLITDRTPFAHSPTGILSEDSSDEEDDDEDDDDDDDEDELSEPECIPDEAVREQYMFMGNLYTLTRIRNDLDNIEMPHVDVASVPNEVLLHDSASTAKANGSAHLASPQGHSDPPIMPPAPVHVSSATPTNADGGVGDRVGGGAPRPPSRPSSRPASLILRSVFPTDASPPVGDTP